MGPSGFPRDGGKAEWTARTAQFGLVLYHRVCRAARVSSARAKMKTAASQLQAAVRLPKYIAGGHRPEIRLEAEGRSEGRPQVVMLAVLEVNLVAHVHPQTNRAP